MDPSFVDRYLNEGFSGGEKKRNEILQMAILEPEVAILDETDSGLDIDALKVVASGVAGGPQATGPSWACCHHPLPAPARLPAARPGAHPHRRPHRRQRRPRAGRAARARGLRELAMRSRRDRRTVPAIRSTSSAIKKDFPILEREVDGQRLVYLDSANVVAEAAAGARRDRPLLRDDPRQRPPRRLRHRRGGDRRATRSARAKVARFIGAAVDREVVFTKNVTEAHQPGRLRVGPGQPRRRRRRAAHRDGAPRQPRALAHARARSGASSCAASRSADDATLDLTDLDRLVDGVKLVGVTAMSNVLGTLTPVDAARRRRPRRRRPRAGRRRPVRAPPAHRRAALGADFVGFTGHKMLRPDRHRRAVGTRGAARGHAAVPRRRRDDPRRPPRRASRPTSCRGSSRPARRPSPRRSASAPPSTTSSGLGMDAVREHEVALTALRPAHAHRALRRRPHHPRPVRAGRAGRRAVVHLPRPPPPRHLPGARRARRVRAGRPPLRQAAHAPARRGATARASLYVYNDEADVDALADALDAAADFFAV